MLIFFFFFSSRRRHTRYWRDWSSDVCSSDLRQVQLQAARDPLGDRESGARFAALHLREHRRRYAAALGEVPQGQVHRLTQVPDSGTEDLAVDRHEALYVIT